jgi:hypothetical protein
MALLHASASSSSKRRSRQELFEAHTPQRISTEEFSHPLLKRLGVTGLEHTVEKGNLRIAYLQLLAKQATEGHPVVVNKGLLAPAIAYVPLLAHMAEGGRNGAVVRSIEYIRKTVGTRVVGFTDVMRRESQAAATAIEDMQAHDGIEQADVLGHSKGVITTSELVWHKPHLVRSANCTAGAGMGGALNPLSLAWHTPSLLWNEIYSKKGKLREELGTNGWRETTRQAREDMLYLPSQTKECLLHDSRPGLRQAAANGVTIGVTAFGQDTFFSAARMLEANSDYVPREFQWLIDDAQHVHPQLYPERHGGEQIEIFDALNAAPFMRDAG